MKFALLFALAATALLSSCGSPRPASRELNVSSFGDPKTFNPITSTETSSWEVLQFVFEGLTEYNPLTQECVGGLAKSWTVSPDGLTWDFILRDSLYWSDGTPIGPDDVVFSFKVGYDPKNVSMIRDNLPLGLAPGLFIPLRSQEGEDAEEADPEKCNT